MSKLMLPMSMREEKRTREEIKSDLVLQRCYLDQLYFGSRADYCEQGLSADKLRVCIANLDSKVAGARYRIRVAQCGKCVSRDIEAIKLDI